VAARDAALTALGRLLLTGIVGGGAIGAVAGATMGVDLHDAESWWALAVVLGALTGIVAGLAVQVVNGLVLAVLRRSGTGTGPQRTALVAVTAVSAPLLTLGVAEVLGSPGVRGAAATALSFVGAVTVAGLLVPWCLQPVAPER
jgi:hypothetical protein